VSWAGSSLYGGSPAREGNDAPGAREAAAGRDQGVPGAASLEQTQRKLAAFREDHANDDVFEAIRDHLSRLGWRTETEQDRERIHQDWVGRALQVLQEVKELEQRPTAPPGDWVEPLRSRRAAYGRAFEPEALERMSADVRAVETGELDQRVKNLALTGRITEQEYRALTKRSSRLL
jgi:hypothetical protein